MLSQCHLLHKFLTVFFSSVIKIRLFLRSLRVQTALWYIDYLFLLILLETMISLVTMGFECKTAGHKTKVLASSKRILSVVLSNCLILCCCVLRWCLPQAMPLVRTLVVRAILHTLECLLSC